MQDNGNNPDDFDGLKPFEEAHAFSGKLNPQVIRQVATMIKMGMRWYQAADVIGVNPKTFWDWRNRGRDDIAAGKQTLHAEFLKSLEKAQSSGILNSLTQLQNLMRGQTLQEDRVKINAKGETIEQVTITRKTAPNLPSIQFYLRNSDPGNWNHDKEFMLQVAEGDDWKTKLEDFSGLEGMDFISEFVNQHAAEVIDKVGEIVGDE